ncbi:hypothetical protein ATN38_04650 [Rhodococcus sp. FH8]|jgi:hypothetical protein|uniref:hypothetical protein n=1 Tax=Rhodococcus TaxID=1827 RepID=UPI000E262CBD|nr:MULTISPECIES: hypothetical protein [Rhodococcus]MBW0286087.1 hypothetical protein [Rhodococcus sp. FH8]MEA1798706.1 hypothetical protein [Rhodococcus qingshengii]REK81781.1 hypothetical protein DVG80_21150 [Rhodococcus erythropolis]UGQ55380.1 hypothetical protein LRL17_30675 [Rhodococcus qingshengii]
MISQLALDAVTLAENVEQPPIATSAPDLMWFVQVLLIAAAVVALCAVLFGLAVVADAAQARRTDRKPRFSPNIDGWRLVSAALVGLVMAVVATVTVTFVV